MPSKSQADEMIMAFEDFRIHAAQDARDRHTQLMQRARTQAAPTKKLKLTVRDYLWMRSVGISAE